MLSKEVRSALATVGFTLGVSGHPVGWVAFAVAIADDIVE